VITATEKKLFGGLFRLHAPTIWDRDKRECIGSMTQQPCPGFQSSNAFLLISRVTLVDLLDGLEVGLLSGRGDCSFSICGLAKLPQAKTRSHSVGLGQAN